MREAVQLFDRALGPRHPQTLVARISASLRTRDPLAARELLRPGCDALVRFSPADTVPRAFCLANLAHHSAEAGDHEDARLALKQAAELLPSGPVDNELMRPIDATLIRGLAALDSGEHVVAVEELRRALAEQRSDDWWRRLEHAELELVLGLHLKATGDRDGAVKALQTAIEGFIAAEAAPRDVIREQRLARARVALADVLLAADAPRSADLDRAAALLAEASHWYLEGGDAYASRLAEVRALDDALARRRSERRATP
jgi:tetratricopeptide (TPR) repeat protein